MPQRVHRLARGLRPSRFHLGFSEGGREYFLSCISGGLLRVPVGAEGIVRELLRGADPDDVPGPLRPLVDELARGGLLVDEAVDELELVRERLAAEPLTRTLGVTIAPTLACNLRCTYCFQAHPVGTMGSEVQAAIEADVERRLDEGTHSALALDWFGGEPLLASELVLAVTQRLRAAATARGLRFEATLATNGVLLNSALSRALRNAGFVELQATLDGPRRVHDARRAGARGEATFDRVLEGIASAAEHLDVRVRVNVDRDTVETAEELLDVLERRGLLPGNGRVLPYLANTTPLDGRCATVAPRMLSHREFFRHSLAFQEALLERYTALRPEDVLEMPRALDRPCGAASEASICFDPAGRAFKCGLDLHEAKASCGRVGEDYRRNADYRRWTTIDPLSRAECRSCSFLPLCLGGCPRFEAGPVPELAGESCEWFREHYVRSLRLLVRMQEKRHGSAPTRNETHSDERPAGRRLGRRAP
jgi:uncharacterized protein